MTESAQLPSNRSFGTVFIVFFTLIGTLSWWWDGTLFPLLFGLAAVTLLATLTAPRLLTPFNKSWMKLGELLNRIVSPLVLGIMYFGLLTPIAVAMRLGNRDSLHRNFDLHAKSYWATRTPPGPDPDSFHNQF